MCSGAPAGAIWRPSALPDRAAQARPRRHLPRGARGLRRCRGQGAARGADAPGGPAAPLPGRHPGRLGRLRRRARRGHGLAAAATPAAQRGPAARHRRAVLAGRSARCRAAARCSTSSGASSATRSRRRHGRPNHDLYFSNRRDPDERLAAEWLPTIPPVVPRLWYGPPARAELPLKVLVGRGSEQGGLGPSEGRRRARGSSCWHCPRASRRAPGRRSQTTAQSWRSSSPPPGGACGPRPPWTLSLSAYRAQLIGSQALPEPERERRAACGSPRTTPRSSPPAGR